MVGTCQGGGSGGGVEGADGGAERHIWHSTYFGRCHIFCKENLFDQTYYID